MPTVVIGTNVSLVSQFWTQSQLADARNTCYQASMFEHCSKLNAVQQLTAFNIWLGIGLTSDKCRSLLRGLRSWCRPAGFNNNVYSAERWLQGLGVHLSSEDVSRILRPKDLQQFNVLWPDLGLCALDLTSDLGCVWVGRREKWRREYMILHLACSCFLSACAFLYQRMTKHDVSRWWEFGKYNISSVLEIVFKSARIKGLEAWFFVMDDIPLV